MTGMFWVMNFLYERKSITKTETNMVNDRDGYLIAVSQTAHTRHNTENVVVHSVDAHLGRPAIGTTADRTGGNVELEGGIVNTGEVARARGLVVLRGKSEGVHVDANRRHVGEVLVRLDQVEVITSTLLEPVVAVELNEGRHNGVLAALTLNKTMGVAAVKHGEVPIIRVVEGLLSVVLIDGSRRASGEVITLDDPGEELDGMVEAHTDLVGNSRDGFLSSELKLLNEVLMGVLSHLAALIRVEVDVVNEQGARLKTLGADIGVSRRAISPAHIFNRGKVDVDLDLVVLEGNQGQSETRVAAVEELKGDVHCVSRGTLTFRRSRGNARGR